MKMPTFLPLLSFRNDFFEKITDENKLVIWNERAIEVMETPCAANVKPEKPHTHAHEERML